MATFDQELLVAARVLLGREAGQRGRLPSARIRRSVSTTYYALFHFVLDEVGQRVIGTGPDLRVRRRALARTISHTAVKTTLDKVRGANVDATVTEFMRVGASTGLVTAPPFIRNLASAFSDAYTMRQDADYDLNATITEKDARRLRLRVRRVIKSWRAARSRSDRDAKHALAALILLKGKLRVDG